MNTSLSAKWENKMGCLVSCGGSATDGERTERSRFVDVSNRIGLTILLTVAGYSSAHYPGMQANAQAAVQTIGCFDDGSVFNTGRSAGGGIDQHWELLTSEDYYIPGDTNPGVQTPPTSGTWQPTFLVTNPAAVWHDPGLANTGWIAHSASGEHSDNPEYLDAFYRYQFYLDERVDTEQLNMNMNFWADNGVYEVWVNGQQQSITNYSSGEDPYLTDGFLAANGASGRLNGPWNKGAGQLNEIIVHVKSFHSHQGFLAQFEPGPLCRARITLQKEVDNGIGGTYSPADFTLSGSDGGADTFSGATGNAAVTDHVLAGMNYTLSESPVLPEYNLAIQCAVDRVDATSGESINATITGPDLQLQSGDRAVCTFTNTYVPATLTLAKTVINESVGANAPTDFVLSAAGPTPLSGIHGSPEVTNVPVALGTYTLSEEQLPGYTASGPFSCSVNGDLRQGNELTLVAGDNAVCTITNIDQGANLTLLSEVINDDGGTATAGDFVLRVDGPVLLEGAQGSESVTNVMVPLGTYTLSQTGPNGYGASLYSCTVNGVAQAPSATITIENNQDAVVCTVINNDIKVTKALVEESGQLPGVAEENEILTYEVTLINEEQGNALYDLVDQPDAATSYVAGSTSGAGEPAGSDPLTWNDVPVPGGGQAAIRYKMEVVELPADRQNIMNCAASTRCVETTVAGRVELQKNLIGDAGGIHEGLAEAGETLTYEIQLENVGAGPAIYTLADSSNPYLSYVSGSTRGTAGANEPQGQSPLVWSDLVIAPGETVTVVYDMLVGDIPDTVKELDNIAFDPKPYMSDDGTYNPPPPDFCTLNPANCSVAETMNITLTKVAQNPQILRGQPVQFLVSLKNNSNATVQNVDVKDVFPAGFRYVSNSASVDGVAVNAEPDGRVLNFHIPEIGPEEETKILLTFQTLASIKPGEHFNIAEARDAAGNPVAPNVRAKVEVMIEAQFDCSEIIGKVFNDLDRNGYQDDGEIGVAGVRVTSTSGLSVTTDSHGRFHVPCAELPSDRTGTNFILKLDPRSLPTGYRILSENPRTIRLTAGKASHLNFATSITRVVRIDVNGEAFEADSAALKPQWQLKLQEVVAMLETEPSVLRMAYIDHRTETFLARQRIGSLRSLISELWKRKRNRYRLEIETSVINSSENVWKQ